MKFPMNALSLVLAAVAGAGAGGAVAYNQFAGAPSARVEAPSATTTAPTVQTEPAAPAPAPQGPPAAQAEAQTAAAETPKAKTSGQAPSSTSQPQGRQSDGADVTELQKQVANHEQRIETLEQSKPAPAQGDTGNTTADKPTSEKPTSPVEHPVDRMLRGVPQLPLQ